MLTSFREKWKKELTDTSNVHYQMEALKDDALEESDKEEKVLKLSYVYKSNVIFPHFSLEIRVLKTLLRHLLFY